MSLDVCRIAMVGKSIHPKCVDKHRGPSSRTGPGPTYRSKWVDAVTAWTGGVLGDFFDECIELLRVASLHRSVRVVVQR